MVKSLNVFGLKIDKRRRRGQRNTTIFEVEVENTENFHTFKGSVSTKILENLPQETWSWVPLTNSKFVKSPVVFDLRTDKPLSNLDTKIKFSSPLPPREFHLHGFTFVAQKL